MSITASVDGDDATVTVDHPSGAVSEVVITMFPAGGIHVVVQAAQSVDCTIEVEDEVIADLEANR